MPHRYGAHNPTSPAAHRWCPCGSDNPTLDTSEVDSPGTASDGTPYVLDESRCGDFPGCHDEPPTCGH